MDPLHLLFPILTISTLFWSATASAGVAAAESAYDALQAHGLPAGLLPQGSRPAGVAAAESAYDALQAHGLPAGLLPQGVRKFSIDDSGRFEAKLDSPCTAKFENEVQYDANVTGTLSYGRIGELSGIAAQELFLWFPVHGIRVDVPSSGLIYFDVGVVHKQFSLSLFESPPECEPVKVLASGEGSRLARIIAQSNLGKLRYDLDQDEGMRMEA